MPSVICFHLVHKMAGENEPHLLGTGLELVLSTNGGGSTQQATNP
jgi:hypothetical protein